MSAILQVAGRPDTTSLEAESSVLIVEARGIAIIDEESYRAAAEFRKGVKALAERIKHAFADAKRKAHQAHGAIVALENTQLAPVTQAEATVRARMNAYHASQERRRLEQTRLLRDEARRLEEERRLQEALDAEQDGDLAAADAILSAPISTPTVAAPPAVPKVAGVSYPTTWSFELEDIAEVARHVGTHPEDAGLLSLNTVTTGQMVRARKELFCVPGIRAFSTTQSRSTK
jgi:hypothetical protein